MVSAPPTVVALDEAVGTCQPSNDHRMRSDRVTHVRLTKLATIADFEDRDRLGEARDSQFPSSIGTPRGWNAKRPRPDYAIGESRMAISVDFVSDLRLFRENPTDMSANLFVTPVGRLSVEENADAVPEVSAAVMATLRIAFAESNADGLLLVASQELRDDLPASFVFFRGLARRLFQAVCQLGETEVASWATVPPPDDEQLLQLVVEAPPMRGLEYLGADLLRSLWRELSKRVVQQAVEHPEGPAGYLRSVNPLWHLLGRVTFHLAENKRDPDRPFAFMATYTHRLSGQTRLQHLPLAGALKTYAGAREVAKLESLLEPVRRAAESSGLVRELVDTKAIFALQAWSIRKAYQFLKVTPQFEAAGIIVRVPNW